MTPDDPGLIRPSKLPRLDASEALGPGTVEDFWRWALSDLRMNLARGYLAEYLVARAVGDPAPSRVEWAPHDVTAADGTRIEVKATGRLQSWASRQPSMPRWTFKSVLAAQVWSDELGVYVAVDPADRVDVWVFALQEADRPDEYDPLDLSQWTFRVVPHRALLQSGQMSGGLALLDRLGALPLTYGELRAGVASARAANAALG